MSASNVEKTPSRPPLHEELEPLVAITVEENRQLRAELAEARQRNKRFVNESLNMYRNIESLLVQGDS